MNILEFMQFFPTEESCKIHFKEQREKIGITCRKCESKKHYWLKSKWQNITQKRSISLLILWLL